MPKQINGGKMKKILISLTTLVTLAGCASGTAPQDDQYFGRITPVPGDAQAQNATPIPPLRPIEGQPVAGDPVAQTTAESDGATASADTSTTAQISTTPVPPSLVEPTLLAPTDATASKKRKFSFGRSSSNNANAKSIDLREYAASQPQLVGQKKYSRSQSKYAQGGNCDAYAVPEIAQIAFLNAGGPRRDSILLDADGDGFACAWVPTR